MFCQECCKLNIPFAKVRFFSELTNDSPFFNRFWKYA